MLPLIGAWLSGLILLFGGAPANAALGTPSEGVAYGVAPSPSITRTRPAGKSYAVHAYTDNAGVRIKEYVSASGIVFAVAWNGPALPEMKNLLGSYFQTYLDHLSVQAHRKYVSMTQEHLVLKSMGGARFFVGHGYTPKLTPADFETKDLG